MNKQGKGKIGWCDYTWSPVVGCKHNCWYCYAKRMNHRFKWIEKWTEPKFYPERLVDPSKVKKPSKIFVCSVADLFGEWVPKNWIEKVLEVVKQNPQHTFQFLTKNPQRYFEFTFPKNCWLGFTIDKLKNDTNTKVNMLAVASMRNYTFISFEPLLSDMSQLFREGMGIRMKSINLLIVGAMTGKSAVKPKQEWIDSIKHKNIFYKTNIKSFLKGA